MMTTTAMTLSSIKAQLLATQQDIFANWQAQPASLSLMATWQKAIDDAILALWSSTLTSPQTEHDFACVAIGGYGRGEQYPYSDIDLLILHLPHANLAPLEPFIQQLWDLGLQIGHSVHTVDSCILASNQDLNLQTSLLDCRLICGNAAHYDTLKTRYHQQLNGSDFFQAKQFELQERHARHQQTPYKLEPNCKESPGALRDLQHILWITKANHLGGTWRVLAARGLLTQEEAAQLNRCHRTLRMIRVSLHLYCKRAENRLLFDIQTGLAKQLSIFDSDEKRCSERLMQRYYRCAKTVSQLSTIVLLNIQAQLFPSEHDLELIDHEFAKNQGLLDIQDITLFEKRPLSILKAFGHLQQHPELRGMTARTLRALWHAKKHINNRFVRDPVNRSVFLSLFKARQGIVHNLRRMNQYGILGQYLPAFRQIEGQMQHDLFHIYTVDQHTLFVIRNLRRFSMPEYVHEFPLCSELMTSLENAWRLYVAALFHDIAKGRGGDHSQLGKEDAREFCESHALNDDDTKLIVFLVENHLLMSQTAQKQDLSDPEVIQQFANKVGNEEYLTALYLLTVADIRGTSPKVWNAWKGKLLEDLFRLSLRYLGGDALHPDSLILEKQAQVLANLASDTRQQIKPFWKKLDLAYFLRHDIEELTWHANNIISHTQDNTPLVLIRPTLTDHVLQISIFCPDQADLFARLCAYFTNASLNVLDARIHTTHDKYALDTFILSSSYALESSTWENFELSLQHAITNLLINKTPLPNSSQHRISRQSRHFPTQPNIELWPDSQGQYYVLTISTYDRMGLLYAISLVFAKYGIILHTAKINTMGEQVLDVFLLEGTILGNPSSQIQFEQALLKVCQNKI